MLLKMRGVPPKPGPRPEDGVLVLWDEDADPRAKSWFESVGVTQAMLRERERPGFSGFDGGKAEGDKGGMGLGPREWELRYVRKVLEG